MEEIIIALLNLAVNGVKALIGINNKTKESLVKLYLEVCRNKTVLAQSGLLKTPVITCDDDTFKDAVKRLSVKETAPMYKYNGKRIFFPNSKKEIERRKTQYALNYTVKQIESLKIIADGKRNKNAPKVRLTVRLKTLYKHLTQLEKVLSPVSKKK